MKTSSLLFAITVFIGFASPLFAEDKPSRNGRAQTVDFTGDTVDGTARHPDASYINQKRKIDFVPLYHVREKFDENIRNNVDYLK